VMQMKTSRLLEIIYILLSKQRMTAKELAEHFEVSTRTIYRDVDAISMAGIPIYAEKGNNGGISLLPNFVLNNLIFNEKEQKEIMSAIQGLSQAQAAGIDPILQKLSAIFNRTAVNWLEIDFAYWGHDKGYMWGDFKTAILERRIVEFDYHSTYGEKTHRSIEPIQLWFKFRAWYLKGFCLTRQDIRTFKLTRVKNLVVTDEFFEERDFLDITSPNPTEHQQPNIQLRLKIDSEMAYRVLDEFASDDIQQEPDGSFIVTVNCRDDSWVHNLVLSFGEHIEVIEPAHIRSIIQKKAHKIIGKYF